MSEKKLSSLNCTFCSTKKAIYVCPRCNVPYCSKTCYKDVKHADCSEQFYKECVEEELKLNCNSSIDKKEILKVLSRLKDDFENDDEEDLDSDDEDSIPDLYDRLENIDLNDADEVWKHLTEQEKNEFHEILKSGNVNELLPEYEPWWCQKFDKKIEEWDTFFHKNKEKLYIDLCPAVKEILPFKFISKIPPSPCIIWNIINVLSSYSLIVRQYLGDHLNDSCHATNVIVELSTNLKFNETFDTKETAIQSVVYQANNNYDLKCSEKEANLIYEDINKFLEGPEKSNSKFFMLSAVCDLMELFSKAVFEKKKPDKKGEFTKKYPTFIPKAVNKNLIHRSIKKLDFYLSWINEFYQKS